jgi:Rod binding domain-containing protein
MTIGPVKTPGAQPPAAPDEAKLKKAAQQFEALMITQLLRAAHGSGSAGWLGGEEDSAADSAIGQAEEQLAQSISQQGGLGFARMIVEGLSRKGDGMGDITQHGGMSPQHPTVKRR